MRKHFFEQTNFYIVTGGPGAGKTTLLTYLKSHFLIIPEVARKIIKQQIKINGEALPWKNKEIYSRMMLDQSIDSYMKTAELAPQKNCLFDRGILDTHCYAKMNNIAIDTEMEETAKTYLYNKKVFILPPWQKIYQTDKERKQTWEEAVYTFHEMKNTYELYGYQLIEVPKASIMERAEFIITEVKNH
jgi:predicted ATPase